MGKAVKKIVKVVAPIAIGFIAGPAVAGALGVTSAAGTAAVTGAVGGFSGGLINGGGLEGALKGAALGGLGGYALGSFGGGGASGLSSGGATPGGLGGSFGLDALTAASTAPASALTLSPAALSSTGFGGAAGAAAYGGAFGTAPAIGTLAAQTAGNFGAATELAGPTGVEDPSQGFVSSPQQPLTQATGAAPSQGGGLLDTLQQKTGITGGQLLKGGMNVAKDMYQSSQQQQLAEAIAQRADPFQQQRGTAVGAGLEALTDPTKHPLYQYLLQGY